MEKNNLIVIMWMRVLKDSRDGEGLTAMKRKEDHKKDANPYRL